MSNRVRPLRRVCGFTLPQWTVIATQGATGRQERWTLTDDAPVTIREAQELASQDLLLMAHRKRGTTWELVIKTPTGDA